MRAGKQGGLGLSRLLPPLLLALGLCACQGSGLEAPTPDAARPTGQRPAAPRRVDPRASLTLEQRNALQRAARRVLPPQAIAALQQLGMPVTGGAPAPAGKGTSITLPFTQDAVASYAPGAAGLLKQSSNVRLTAGALKLEPSGSDYPGNFAYVIYRVDDVPQLAHTLELYTSGSGNFGVAMYNWAHGTLGRWEPLYYGPGSGLSDYPTRLRQGDIAGADFTNSNADLAFILFSLAPARIDLLRFGLSDDSENVPPAAALSVTPQLGAAPLECVLFAGNSYDEEGPLMKYRFDPLGSGSWVDNGTDPYFSFTYEHGGHYEPRVEVTDRGGKTAVASTYLNPWTVQYDEVEDNDEPGSANPLPRESPFRFDGFDGHLGAGGYDGDSEDIYSFEVPSNFGDRVRLQLAYSTSGGAQLGQVLEDSAGTVLATTSGGSPQVLAYQCDGSEIAPFYLRVQCAAGAVNYVLSGDNLAYTETEDNDDPLSADLLDYDRDWISSVGSLGSREGYVAIDGDNEDWWVFSAIPGEQFTLLLGYDEALVNVGVTLLDANMEVLANSAGGDGTEELSYSVGGEHTAAFYLHIVSSSGGGDYGFFSHLEMSNPGFDEEEHNDWGPLREADTLPAVPFSAYTGNIGDDGGWDGDTDDYYVLQGIDSQDLVKLTITPERATPNLEAWVFDANLRPAGGWLRDPDTGALTVHLHARSLDEQPYYLHLQHISAHTDYTIDAEPAALYSEVEPNDDEVQATLVPAFFDYFSGSLGSGGSDYDGGTVDVYRFFAPPGTTPEFELQFDEYLAGQLEGELRDSDGDVLGTLENLGNGAARVVADRELQPFDVAPYYLEVRSATGFTDYYMQRPHQ